MGRRIDGSRRQLSIRQSLGGATNSWTKIAALFVGSVIVVVRFPFLHFRWCSWPQSLDSLPFFGTYKLHHTKECDFRARYVLPDPEARSPVWLRRTTRLGLQQLYLLPQGSLRRNSLSRAALSLPAPSELLQPFAYGARLACARSRHVGEPKNGPILTWGLSILNSIAAVHSKTALSRWRIHRVERTSGVKWGTISSTSALKTPKNGILPLLGGMNHLRLYIYSRR